MRLGADVAKSDRKLNITAPLATRNGETIADRVYAELISYADEVIYSLPIVWGGSIAYPPARMDDPAATLTMRRYRDGTSRWRCCEASGTSPVCTRERSSRTLALCTSDQGSAPAGCMTWSIPRRTLGSPVWDWRRSVTSCHS